MHIAYLHYLYGRDTALHHVRQFAEAATGLGHRIDTHAMNLAPPPTANDDAGRRSLALTVRDQIKRRFGRYLHDPKELLWNVRYARRERALLAADRPDALLVRSHGLGLSCLHVARRLDLPLVLEVNAPSDETSRYQQQYLHWTRLRHSTGRLKLRRADGIVVVSGALKSHYVEDHGIDADKITVAINGADVERFHPAVEIDPQLTQQFPEPAGPWIGYVGSFQQWHDFELLAALIERVGAARPDCRFLMVGSGDGADLLRQHTQLPAERLHFTGRVEHRRVPGLVAALDIGLLADAAPYQCPLKVVEWMAAGRAIVAPAYDPLRELIDDGVHGVLFPPRDLDAMVDAVLRLLDAPDLRQRLGAAAARRAHERFAWRHNAEQVVDACRRARDRHRGKWHRGK